MTFPKILFGKGCIYLFLSSRKILVRGTKFSTGGTLKKLFEYLFYKYDYIVFILSCFFVL